MPQKLCKRFCNIGVQTLFCGNDEIAKVISMVLGFCVLTNYTVPVAFANPISQSPAFPQTYPELESAHRDTNLIAMKRITQELGGIPVLRPLYGAKTDVVPPPRKPLESGVEQNVERHFGAILLKDNDAFPVFDPELSSMTARTAQSQAEKNTEDKSKLPALSGNVLEQIFEARADEASEQPFDLHANQIALQQPPFHAELNQAPDTKLATAELAPLHTQTKSWYEPGWMSYQEHSKTVHNHLFEKGSHSEKDGSSLTVKKSDRTHLWAEWSLEWWYWYWIWVRGRYGSHWYWYWNWEWPKFDFKLHKLHQTEWEAFRKNWHTKTDRTGKSSTSNTYETVFEKTWHQGRWHQESPPEKERQASLAANQDAQLTEVAKDQTNLSIESSPEAGSQNPESLTTQDTAAASDGSELEALKAMQESGNFSKAPPVKKVEVDWDPWYRSLIAAACAKFASLETQEEKVALIVTVKSDGRIECLPVPNILLDQNDNGASSEQATDFSTASPQAKRAIMSLGQTSLTHFPAKSKRKSVTFEVEFICSYDKVADYVDLCAPDVEHVVVTVKAESSPESSSPLPHRSRKS
jgi:hypothetical protein